MAEPLTKLGDFIQTALKENLLCCSYEGGELTLRVEREAIVKVLTFLRDSSPLQFHQLIDICGVDFPARQPRFDVVYHLLSLKHNQRVRVKLATEADIAVPSVTSLFRCANWWEREVWDMFGISFLNHPDLRRILTDYEFEGHPLRKDFPLTGYVEVRYDNQEERVVYEPVKLPQDFRSFDFLSPWEGAQSYKHSLPGDEKNNLVSSEELPLKS